jgi:hypothetical protein
MDMICVFQMGECNAAKVSERIAYWTRINDAAKKELADMPPPPAATVAAITASATQTDKQSSTTPTTGGSENKEVTEVDESQAPADAAIHQLKFWTQVQQTSEKELQAAGATRDGSASSTSGGKSTISDSIGSEVAKSKLKPKIK